VAFEIKQIGACTRFFSSSINFKRELKAQLGSCRPLSTIRSHLLSNVGPSIEIALKKHLNLLKYDSLVYGDLIGYSNRIYGSAAVSFCNSNCVNSTILTYRVQLENYWRFGFGGMRDRIDTILQPALVMTSLINIKNRRGGTDNARVTINEPRAN